ncbi:MAG TPA: hypothetical protein DCR43_05860 [Bacteroidales bacterium]|nr:MAG: hypothetical protein A2X11_02980 [Bacteroidetes bacterium GWE2_42_24]OFY25494.1 MAG: hypothetical protein A2X09_13345 [Bacteroidetes bacterium GWF2_43_11]HAQ65360.1 hypothetical protein [Bacteroidales bacterium]HBZ65475.1 hypothetical protein [Bacteroidales bacterium]
MNETMLLREKEVIPDDHTLEMAMGIVYPVYHKLMNIIKSEANGLTCQWNYYNDGKAWLMKAVWKKKTVFWLSVWEGYFKVGFFFTEKTITGIHELPISQMIKDSIPDARPVGRLIPLSINVEKTDQTDDLIQLVNYKKHLK